MSARVVSDFMKRRLHSKGLEWTATAAGGTSDPQQPVSESLSSTLQQQASQLMTEYGEAIRDMVRRSIAPSSSSSNASSCLSRQPVVVDACSQPPPPAAAAALEPRLDNYDSFRLMADSMISDGVQWSDILTLMVFVSELAFEQVSEPCPSCCLSGCQRRRRESRHSESRGRESHFLSRLAFSR